MDWQVKLSNSALKFINSADEKTGKAIRNKILELANYISKGIVPFRLMDIKKLKGSWKNFLRLRIGRIRVIFNVDISAKTIRIYEIDFRGNIY